MMNKKQSYSHQQALNILTGILNSENPEILDWQYRLLKSENLLHRLNGLKNVSWQGDDDFMVEVLTGEGLFPQKEPQSPLQAPFEDLNMKSVEDKKELKEKIDNVKKNLLVKYEQFDDQYMKVIQINKDQRMCEQKLHDIRYDCFRAELLMKNCIARKDEDIIKVLDWEDIKVQKGSIAGVLEMINHPDLKICKAPDSRSQQRKQTFCNPDLKLRDKFLMESFLHSTMFYFQRDKALQDVIMNKYYHEFRTEVSKIMEFEVNSIYPARQYFEQQIETDFAINIPKQVGQSYTSYIQYEESNVALHADIKVFNATFHLLFDLKNAKFYLREPLRHHKVEFEQQRVDSWEFQEKLPSSKNDLEFRKISLRNQFSKIIEAKKSVQQEEVKNSVLKIRDSVSKLVGVNVESISLSAGVENTVVFQCSFLLRKLTNQKTGQQNWVYTNDFGQTVITYWNPNVVNNMWDERLNTWQCFFIKYFQNEDVEKSAIEIDQFQFDYFMSFADFDTTKGRKLYFKQ